MKHFTFLYKKRYYDAETMVYGVWFLYQGPGVFSGETYKFKEGVI